MPASRIGSPLACTVSMIFASACLVPSGGSALQRIVGAKLDDDGARVVRQRPIEPRQPGRRRVAGHAGIDDRHFSAARFQRRLELRGKGLVLRQAEPRRETVAEGDDHRRLRLCRNSVQRREQEACREHDQ